MTSQDYIALDEKYGAHNYHPLPVVISWAEGCRVRDPEGKQYFDFLSAYSAVNQGHRHPAIIQAVKDQLDAVTLTSRAFHNDKMGLFLQKLCDFTGYEMALPMNTGAEAVETALKAARRWGVEKKGVQNGKQEIICVEENFHGRTIAVISMSNDPDSTVNYGPYVTGFVRVPYAVPEAIEAAVTPNTVAVIIEPIQGEAGVYVPPVGYLKAVRDLCTKHKVLFICDEIQTGFSRTGKRFAWQHEDARPDIMCLGKALGGGIMPISAIVADHEVMDVFTPGTHGSTFGGNPLACAAGLASLEALLEDNIIIQNVGPLGSHFLDGLRNLKAKYPFIRDVRGKGLLVGMELDFDGKDIVAACMREGFLINCTMNTVLRFIPPLIISEEEIDRLVNALDGIFKKR